MHKAGAKERRGEICRAQGEGRKILLGHKDCLTGLMSRRGIFEVFEKLAVDRPVSLLYIDIDNFKMLNDLFGHEVGDECLKTLGSFLERLGDDVVSARLGGDEFVVFLFGLQEKRRLLAVQKNLLAQLGEAKAKMTGCPSFP